MSEILISLGLEGAADVQKALASMVKDINKSLAGISMPDFSGLGRGKNKPEAAAFDLARASLGELQKELAKLQKQFAAGSDTSAIKAIQDRIASLKNEIKGTPNLSERLKGEGKVKLDLSNFDIANAKMSELKAALASLKANLTVGGDTSQIKAIQAQMRLLNDSIREASRPAKPKIDYSNIDIANASVKELKAALAQLTANFKVGGDTSQIRAIQERIKEAKAEMSGAPPTSFTDRLKQAFKDAAGGLFDFKQRILEIASGNLLANLFQEIGNGIVQAGKYAIQSAGQFEAIGASLNVMTGSVEKGTMIFGQFQKLASTSPFNFDNVAEQGTKLLAMGIPIADVTDRLSRIGDVAAGVGREKLPSIVYAYGQIKTAGKAMAGDISQFINAGVPIIENLAEVMGKPQSAIKELASAGKIGFAEIDAALLNMTNEGGTFFNMMQTQSGTFEGLWSSMEDSFQILAAGIGQKLLPAVKSITVGITNVVGALGDYLNGTKSLMDSDVPFLRVLGVLGKLGGAFASPIFESFGAVMRLIGNNADSFSLALQIGGAALAAYGAQVAIVKGLALAQNAATFIGIGLERAAAVARGIYTVASEGLAAAIGKSTAQTGLNTIASRANAAAQAAMWLVSNPAGWALLAAGAVAATAAYFAFTKESEAMRRSNEAMSSLTSQLTEKYQAERVQIDGLFSLLKDTKPSEVQKQAYSNLSKSLQDVTSKYSLEKDLLGQTQKQSEKKAAMQERAARKLVELYGETYKSELSLQGLLAKGAAADLQRQRIQDKIRKDRLNAIAEEFAAEAKLKAFKAIFEAETGKVIQQSKEQAEEYAAQSSGFLSTLVHSISQVGNGWNGISGEMEKLNEQSANAKAELDILSDPTKLNRLKDAVQGAFGKKDLSGLFDAKEALKELGGASDLVSGSLGDLKAKLAEAEKLRENSIGAGFVKASGEVERLKKQIEALENSAKGADFAPNSLKAMQEKLSAVNEQMQKIDPNSKGFVQAATKAQTLEKEIAAVQERLKTASYDKGSLADLQAQLSAVNEQVQNLNPNSKSFEVAANSAKLLDTQIAAIKEKMEGALFEAGSLDAMDKELSKLRENLGKLAPDSDSFLATATKAQALEKEIAALNLEISNIGKASDSVSVLQSRLQAVQDVISLTSPQSAAYDGLLAQSRALNSELKAVQERTELGLLEKGSLEYSEKQLSSLQNKLKTAFLAPAEISNTNAQIAKLNAEITQTKVRLGELGGEGSLEQMGRQISDLESSFQKATTGFERFSLGGQIEALKRVKEAAEASAGAIEGIDLSKIKASSPDFSGYEFVLKYRFELAGDKIIEITKGSNIPRIEIPELAMPKLDEQAALLNAFNQSLREMGLGANAAGASMGLLDSGIDKVALGLQDKFGLSLEASKQKALEWGRNISELFANVGESIRKGLAEGIGGAAFAFAEGFGQMITVTGSFGDAWAAAKNAALDALLGMADALLVQIPKVLGMGLLQSAFSPAAIATFPANLGLAAVGLGLLGASGLMSGVLKGVQKKREQAKEPALPSSLTNQAVQDSMQTQTGGRAALGASAYNGEKPQLLATIVINQYQTGVSGEILSETQRQYEIAQELK